MSIDNNIKFQVLILKWTLPIGFVIAAIVIGINLSNFKKDRIKYPTVEIKDTFHSKIKDEKDYQGVSYIELNDSSFFRINHSANKEINPSDLHKFISIGDSIYKKQHNDTLVVIRDTKKYVFRIGKIINNEPIK